MDRRALRINVSVLRDGFDGRRFAQRFNFFWDGRHAYVNTSRRAWNNDAGNYGCCVTCSVVKSYCA